MSGLGDDGDPYYQANIADWVLTSIAGCFLFVRLWCRVRFSHLGWDDLVLATSWALMFIAAAMVSHVISVGYDSDDDKRSFYLYQNTSTALTTIATSWSKVAFAITLIRIVRNRAMKYFLWIVISTETLILVPGMLSIWIPACDDPRMIFRPETATCFDLQTLQYLGGTTIVYGGVIDVVLALFPWLVIRKLLLETREKVGLSIAMSLGALTGVVVIIRAFFQFIPTDNNFHFMVFMSIFNFLEPAFTIIAQTIPIFRVLFVNVKRNSVNNATVRLSSPPTSLAELVIAKVVSSHEQHDFTPASPH